MININMQIEVKRSTDYWDTDGTSRKAVPEDVVELSEDLYICDEEIPGYSSKIARLISGVRGSTELGWHHDPDWLTVCPINSEYAIFRGIRKKNITKVDKTNNALLEILRETYDRRC